MKGYYIEVTNNLLDPKHRVAMRESVWLFLWCLDKMTSIAEDGVGRVLGGRPIKYKEILDDLGITERTYSRWVSILRKGGYIKSIRTPYGLSLSVIRAKKRFGRRDTPKLSYPDTPKQGERYAKTGVEIRQKWRNK